MASNKLIYIFTNSLINLLYHKYNDIHTYYNTRTKRMFHICLSTQLFSFVNAKFRMHLWQKQIVIFHLLNSNNH